MVKAKKHLGQHFLKDPNIAKKLAAAVQLRSAVLEVGPGTGILTAQLNDITDNLRAVEVDEESIDYLLSSGLLESGQLINFDFLKLDFDRVFNSEFSVVGNFPYYISSQIVFKIVESFEKVPEMVGMFQKEVAERICSGPGSKKFGGISVLVASRYKAEYLFTIDETEFYPPPKVKSAVIRLERIAKPMEEESYKRLSTLVKLAFNQRRKTLRNSLKSLRDIIELPEEMSSLRPEQCSLEDFIALAKQLP